MANLSGRAVDLILETPGGSGEVAEDMVQCLRSKYGEVGIIVPGYAKSAGTIMAMSANEILMDTTSSLGPIDAQIQWQGKVFSADALLQGMTKIKEEVKASGTLNRAYIPILQGISPGELQNAENALKFARSLVTQWLVRYKFHTWEKHSSTGKLVSRKEKERQAEKIAAELCNHGRWLTHGRSIKLEDLEEMGLKITDFSATPPLADAIGRYFTLLQMTFATNVYKVFETPTSQIYRFLAPSVPPPQQFLKKPGILILEVKCGNCGFLSRVQASIGAKQPTQEGCVAFPDDNKLVCPNCRSQIDISDARRQIEMQTKDKLAT